MRSTKGLLAASAGVMLLVSAIVVLLFVVSLQRSDDSEAPVAVLYRSLQDLHHITGLNSCGLRRSSRSHHSQRRISSLLMPQWWPMRHRNP